MAAGTGQTSPAPARARMWVAVDMTAGYQRPVGAVNFQGWGRQHSERSPMSVTASLFKILNKMFKVHYFVRYIEHLTGLTSLRLHRPGRSPAAAVAGAGSGCPIYLTFLRAIVLYLCRVSSILDNIFLTHPSGCPDADPLAGLPCRPDDTLPRALPGFHVVLHHRQSSPPSSTVSRHP